LVAAASPYTNCDFSPPMIVTTVGLSDISHLSEGQFLVLERDDQAGPDAAIKRVYFVDMGDDLSSVDGITLTKTLVSDLMVPLAKPGGLIIEKVEGMTVDGDGNLWINTDNDGLDDNSGEQQLMNLGGAVLPAH
jgi:Esterase-like activity of phytase